MRYEQYFDMVSLSSDQLMRGKIRRVWLNFPSRRQLANLICDTWWLAFITLNILDAHITNVNLAQGASELNPLALHNVAVRAILAAGIGMVIFLAGKKKWLIPLSILALAVVLWNFVQWLGA
jgi:hypothetical protein